MRAAALIFSLTFGACSGSRQSPPPDPPSAVTIEAPDASPSANADPAPVAEADRSDASADTEPGDGGERLVTLGTLGDSGSVLGALSADASGLSALFGATDAGPLQARQSPAQAGDPAVSGQYDKPIVRRFIQRQLHRVRACYQRALTNHPDLATKLVVEFVIGTDGNVQSAKALTPSSDPSLDACVLAVIIKTRFPTPRSGIVRVRYPFVFRAAP